MTKRDIIILPDPLLRSPSAPVERVDDELRTLMDDMLETMYDAPGIGLAAVQLGVPRRAIVMDVNYRRADEEGGEMPKAPLAMVNPEIVARSDALRVHEEGCLSIPEFYAEIERPAKITVRYIDRDGKQQEMECEDVLATVVQHEVDHLNGKLFIDYLSRLKRYRVIKKFVKAAKGEMVA
ncbi:MAG: peptide deformylase [Methyloligellaceae bacterium]